MIGPRGAVSIAGGALALLAGCSTASSRIENDTFYSPKGYSVVLPGQGWRVTPGGAADLELKRESPPGGMLADATCEGVARERPLPVLVRHLTFGLTGRATVESDELPRAGQPAAHRVVHGLVDGTPMGIEAIVVKGERCVHDFLYVAPLSAFDAGRPAFAAFVASLAPAAERR
jgi:hypothetical protein